ncbi:MAG: hypothetical protein ACI4U3_07070 [Traorella sp.]
MTTIKQVFDEHMNHEEIKEYVLSSKRKYFFLKSAFALCICILCVFTFLNLNDLLVIGDKNDIHINKITTSQVTNYDLDIIIHSITDPNFSYNSSYIYDTFPFIQKLENYQGYESDIYLVYSKENNSINEYNILHDWIFTLKKDSLEIKIRFSDIGKPLRDVFFETKSTKQSTIHNVSMTIYQLNDLYYASFENNGLYFNIEAQNVNLNEFIEILEILTKQ